MAIDVFYRQITVPQNKVPAYDEMTKSEVNQILAIGVAQIKAGETVGMDDVF